MDWIFVKFAKTLFLGHFDPFLPKNGEIGKIRLRHFLAFMDPQHHAKNQKNPMTQF